MAKKKAKKKSTEETAAGNEKRPSRLQLEKLDREILALINKRAELTVSRAQAGGPERGHSFAENADVLQKVVGLNEGPLRDDAVRAVFRELLSGSHGVGHRTRVAYLGPEYTYSHLAAIERFGQSAELMPVGTIASVFEEVERRHAEYGLVPIENSTDGRVTDALDCLARSCVKICGEVPLRIRHCLLGIGERSKIERVYSKTQPLSQCRNWLSKHLPGAQLLEVASTAEAAQKAAKDASAAAIASQQAGANYSLSILASSIEDNPDNVTRFAVISTESGGRTGNDKTALVFELDHQPGALADSMGIFKRHKLNLTWIESFPLPGQRGRYLFFVEFQGHASELRARRAIASLEKKATRLTVLGSYAHAEAIG
ncbi:MAG: prephenate dehydratase [Planctomycetales bacterium]|nr:prephenate dehydratase [Planctomycetales bacterium]